MAEPGGGETQAVQTFRERLQEGIMENDPDNVWPEGRPEQRSPFKTPYYREVQLTIDLGKVMAKQDLYVMYTSRKPLDYPSDQLPKLVQTGMGFMINKYEQTVDSDDPQQKRDATVAMVKRVIDAQKTKDSNIQGKDVSGKYAPLESALETWIQDNPPQSGK